MVKKSQPIRNLQKNSVLVIAPHPDDETLGCGGTLLRHAANGDLIHWLIVTDMIPAMFSHERIAKRENEISRVASKYGFASVNRLHFPATRLGDISDNIFIDAVSEIIRKICPHTVYLPFMRDVHSDHRRVFDVALACTKTFRFPSVKRVLMMEVLSETEFASPVASEFFTPNVYVDISDYMDRKLEILSLYDGESAAAPFPRSIETVRGLACFRGAVAGCRYAEAFMLLREIQ
jgi:LmbE family N-acetylglucosaminyl deacetylase